jgi:hypothetical protein
MSNVYYLTLFDIGLIARNQQDNLKATIRTALTGKVPTVFTDGFAGIDDVDGSYDRMRIETNNPLSVNDQNDLIRYVSRQYSIAMGRRSFRATVQLRDVNNDATHIIEDSVIENYA